jgi:hypothetical protein
MGLSSSRLASGRPPRPDGRPAGSESGGSEPVSARGNEGAQQAGDTPAETPAQAQAPLASPRGSVPSFPASPRAAVPPASPRAGSLASPRPSPRASPRTTVASPRTNPLSMSAFGGATTAAGSVATPGGTLVSLAPGLPPVPRQYSPPPRGEENPHPPLLKCPTSHWANPIFFVPFSAPNIPGWERGPPPETPELDPEDWRLSIQQVKNSRFLVGLDFQRELGFWDKILGLHIQQVTRSIVVEQQWYGAWSFGNVRIGN